MDRYYNERYYPDWVSNYDIQKITSSIKTDIMLRVLIKRNSPKTKTSKEY